MLLYVLAMQTMKGGLLGRDISLTVVFASFAIGFLSDVALNLYFRGSRATSARGRQLRAYIFYL